MKKRTRRRSWHRRIARLALLALGAWLIVTVLVVALLRVVDPPTSSFMLQRSFANAFGNAESDRLRQQWQPLGAIAPALRIAVVAAEDQKFPKHDGFDLEALREAAAEHLAGEGGGGGSTISQQTAKNLFLWPGRSLFRKGLEAYFTVLIEALWPKRRILEVYLNVAEFGEDIYGAEAAAQAFFGKPASALTAREAAQLAAVLPSPRRYRAQPPSTYVSRRAGWIQRQVVRLGGPGYLAPIGAN